MFRKLLAHASLVIVASFVSNSKTQAQEVKWDAFIDTYYAYDLNRPIDRDRAFTTQPARHNEFNINLALLGVTYEHDKIKGRVSLQSGTYVQSNYSSEPTEGTYSGPEVSRHIQDAFIEYQVGGSSHVIAGVFPSHIGYESVLSIENISYTRSLAADYSPYYQSGVGLVQNLNASWSLEAYVLNGWQNISEDDDNKALGLALRYQSEHFDFNYSNFIGHYQGVKRHFHDLNFTWRSKEWLTIGALLDWGVQDLLGEGKFFSTFNTQAKIRLDDLQSLSLRVERYEDVHGLNIPTGNGRDFSLMGYSIGYNHWLNSQAQFRAEWRYLHNQGGVIFPSQDSVVSENQLFLVSLALKI